jgi:cysteine-rich repeat protein
VSTGETCDPPGGPAGGNGNDCRQDCTVCGDGIRNGGEECDDGNGTDGDGCDNDCFATPPPTCGDGTVSTGETCDPPGSPAGGNGNDCRQDCTVCGDGIPNGGEECDDGNGIDGDGCENDCTETGGTTTTTSTSSTTTTSSTSTTSSTTIPPEICTNGTDDDGDGLVDCMDPDCIGRPECQPMAQDPAIIRFGSPGEGRDSLRAHGLIRPVESIDPAGEEVFIMLTNLDGIIYRGSLIAGDLVPNASGGRLSFKDTLARRGEGSRFGIYRITLRQRPKTWFFTFRAYGDLSAATDPNMNLQLQVGNQGFISNAVWEPTRNGWRATFQNLHTEPLE